MAAVGLAPSTGPWSRRMSATSRSWSNHNHDGAIAPAQLLSVSLCGAVVPRAQGARADALDLGDYSGRHAGVARRRLELVVSKQRLNHPNVFAVLEQMGCEGMAKRNERESVLRSPAAFAASLNSRLN